MYSHSANIYGDDFVPVQADFKPRFLWCFTFYLKTVIQKEGELQVGDKGTQIMMLKKYNELRRE